MARNPYEDLDLIDPWAEDDDEEEDATGNFSFVEDPYQVHGNPFEDSFPDAFQDVESTPDERGGTFPRTVVRQSVVEAPRADTARIEGGRVLHRRRRDGRVAGAPSVPPQRQSPVPSPPQPARQRREPRPRKRRHLGCFIWLLILVAVVCGAYWLVAHPIDEKLAFDAQEQQTLRGALSLYVPSTPSYILALGSDAREGEIYSRTDSMLLVRVDFWGGKVTMLSIPRDTMVEIEGYGTQKINAAYAFGGAGGAVRAVSKLCGVGVNHVAVVHFDELAGIVDYLGGITVNVPTAVYDPDYTGLVLDAGIQTLDGETALAWARSRYGFETGDFQRQENQRILLSAIVNRMLSEPPTKISGLIDRIGDLIGTDLRCYNLVPLFLRFKLQAPVIYAATVPSYTDWVDGVSYVIADEEALAQTMRVIDAGGDPGELGW